MDYKTFIEQLNNYQIKEVDFSVTNYGHYKNCKIIVSQVADIRPSKSNQLTYLFSFYLTQDNSEFCNFYVKFNEDEKIFYIKGKGKQTLKNLWKDIKINNIVYF